MTREQFDIGIGILQSALRRKYSDESILLFWGELRENIGEAFIFACRRLARESLKLPVLSELLEAIPEEKGRPYDYSEYSELAKKWGNVHPDSWILFYPHHVKTLEGTEKLSKIQAGMPGGDNTRY